MDPHELIAAWQREEQQPFTGWDFSYLDGRMLEEQAPWSYSCGLPTDAPGFCGD